MIVKLKPGKRVPAGLASGQCYPVLGIEADAYRIIDRTGRPYLYESRHFTIVDREIPKEWVIEQGEEGETYAYPRRWRRPGFFEDFFDGKQRVIAAFWQVVNGQLMNRATRRKRARTIAGHRISVG